MIHVFLVGDIRLNREGLTLLLGRDTRLHVIGHAAAGEELLLRGGSVDVIVVDTAANDEALRRMVSDADAPVVALGAPDDEEHVMALAELGVMGFVERGASLDELVASVASAARGEASFPPRIATTLLRRVSSLGERRAASDLTSLTVRERQVVQLIAEGLTNKEIAARLTIEVATVKNHVHNILEKLEVNRRSDAVARLQIVPRDTETSAAVPLFERSTPRSTTG